MFVYIVHEAEQVYTRVYVGMNKAETVTANAHSNIASLTCRDLMSCAVASHSIQLCTDLESIKKKTFSQSVSLS